jgi:hypothetical protein
MMGGQPRMGAMVDGRLAYLKGELGITDAQTKAWDAYATVVKARVDLMQDMQAKMVETMHKGTATDRMNSRIAGMEAMLDSLKGLAISSRRAKLSIGYTPPDRAISAWRPRQPSGMPDL